MVLTGETLKTALQRTRKPVDLRDKAGALVLKLTDIHEILSYLGRCGYEAHGTNRRVRSIRPAAPKPFVAPLIPWQDCWLTRAAAVIRFHGECA